MLVLPILHSVFAYDQACTLIRLLTEHCTVPICDRNSTMISKIPLYYEMLACSLVPHAALWASQNLSQRHLCCSWSMTVLMMLCNPNLTQSGQLFLRR